MIDNCLTALGADVISLTDVENCEHMRIVDLVHLIVVDLIPDPVVLGLWTYESGDSCEDVPHHVWQLHVVHVDCQP